MLSLNGTGPCGGTEESGQCWHAARPARTTPSLSPSSHRPRRLALLPSSGLRSAGALPRSAGSLVGARSGAGCVGVRPRGSQALALAYASRRPATSSAPSLPSQQLRLQHHHRPAAAPPARPGLLLQQSNPFQRHLRAHHRRPHRRRRRASRMWKCLVSTYLWRIDTHYEYNDARPPIESTGQAEGYYALRVSRHA